MTWSLLPFLAQCAAPFSVSMLDSREADSAKAIAALHAQFITSRVAIDIYNRGIVRGFAKDDGLHFNPDEPSLCRFRLVKFTQAADMDERGLRSKYH